MRYSKKSLLMLPGLVGVMVFASCKKDNGIVPEVSALSFVNASVGAPELNVFIEQSRVNNEAFAFGKNINYLNAFSGEREINFYEGTVKKTSGKVNLQDGKFYSLFLAGNWPETELVLLKDSLTNPITGKTNLRFVNMGKDAGELDLGLTNGSTLISQKAYKAGSDYIAVDGNKSYTFVIRNHTALSDTVSIPAVNLEAGRSYTIWAKGLKTGNDATALGLSLIKH